MQPSKKLLFGLALLMLTVLPGLAARPTYAQDEVVTTKSDEHCVMHIDPVAEGATESTVTKVGCYATFSEALNVATYGQVTVDPEFQAPDLTEEMLLPSSMVSIISVDYWDSGYRGRTYTWRGAANSGCRYQSYHVNSMPSGWNDEMSSTRGYSYCNRNRLYEHTYRRGAVRTCTPDCSSLGAMNDNTSSRHWSYQP